MSEEEKPTVNNEEVPRVTLRLTDPRIFNVEVDFATPSLQCARAMLQEGLHTIQSMIEDANAVEFQAKMNKAAQAFRAMSKKPLGRIT